MVNPELSADCHASGTVRIVAWAAKECGEIALCGHHLARNRAKLADEGWIIYPFSTLDATPGVGTESTGQHYAITEGTP